MRGEHVTIAESGKAEHERELVRAATFSTATTAAPIVTATFTTFAALTTFAARRGGRIVRAN